jgi:hypothetical protein
LCTACSSAPSPRWPTWTSDRYTTYDSKELTNARAEHGSATVAKYRHRIASYTSTATKHGIGILQAIRDALLGRPWTAELPAAW